MVMSLDNNRHRWWRRSELWRMVSVLLLGQCISLVLAILYFTSSLSANLGANSPVTLGLCGYSALTLIHGSILLYQGHKLIIPWYWYALLAFIDVQGNYLYNSAYYFTSITSVAFGDCLGHNSYLDVFGHKIFYMAVTWCSIMLCGSNPLLGDILIIGATVFFALSSVGQEFCVKKNGILEVLAMLGLFGMFFSMIEIAIFERKNLEEVTWSNELILTFGGYTVSSFMFYTLSPLLLQASGATLFNLSILTSDMWAVVIRIFFYHQYVDWLYFVSFSIVGVGLFVYSKTEKNHDPSLEPENEILNQQYQLVREQGIESQDATSQPHSSL